MIERLKGPKIPTVSGLIVRLGQALALEEEQKRTDRRLPIETGNCIVLGRMPESEGDNVWLEWNEEVGEQLYFWITVIKEKHTEVWNWLKRRDRDGRDVILLQELTIFYPSELSITPKLNSYAKDVGELASVAEDLHAVLIFRRGEKPPYSARYKYLQGFFTSPGQEIALEGLLDFF